jgi:hypothetical protein
MLALQVAMITVLNHWQLVHFLKNQVIIELFKKINMDNRNFLCFSYEFLPNCFFF